MKLSFYEQLKLINCIRKEKVDSGTKEINVMDITERILGREWDNVQFYFPTYADDHLLQMLDFDDDIEEDEYNYIYVEDAPDIQKIKRNSILKDLVSDLQREQITVLDKKHKKTRIHTTEKPKEKRGSIGSHQSKQKEKRKERNPEKQKKSER